MRSSTTADDAATAVAPAPDGNPDNPRGLGEGFLAGPRKPPAGGGSQGYRLEDESLVRSPGSGVGHLNPAVHAGTRQLAIWGDHRWVELQDLALVHSPSWVIS